MAAVAFRLTDRVYGLDQDQAQFLAGQLQRRLTIPEPLAVLADTIWGQSLRNPDAAEISQDIVLTAEQARALLETMSAVKPDGDADAWESLTAGLRLELVES